MPVMFIHPFCCFSFGYVDFTSKEEHKKAIALSGTEFYGRELNIDVANKISGGGGRGRGGGRGGGDLMQAVDFTELAQAVNMK